MAASYSNVPHNLAAELGLFRKSDGTHGRIFTGQSDAEVYGEMDRVRDRIAAVGGAETHRAKIGRNTVCPCGSGVKYKKCCLHGALQAA